MGIEDIQKEVLQAAEYDAARLKKDAEKQARDIIGEAKDKAEEMRKGFREGLKRAAERERRKALGAAHFGAASSVLRLKKELMDMAVAEAKARLPSLPAERRKAHIKALIERAGKDIEVAHVLCAKKDIPYVQGHLAEEAPIAGGIIAESADRTMRVDLSYDTLFAVIVEDSVEDVYKALFGKEK